MDKYAFQNDIAEDLLYRLQGSTHVVLGAAPTTGKTFILIKLLNRYFKENPGHKVLFLGSNQKVLVDQFEQTLIDSKTFFTFSRLKDESDKNLKIGLPQIASKTAHKYDLIILDEAHHLWPQIESNHHSMMNKIRARNTDARYLLVSGTVGWFNERKDKYDILHFSHEKALETSNQIFSKVEIDVVRTKYEFSAISGAIAIMNKARDENVDLSKILIVTKNTLDAKLTESIMRSLFKRNVCLSTSKTDPDNKILESYKTGQYDCCISIAKTIKGFSDPNITSLWDLRGSQSTEATYQLLARILRFKDEATTKTYFRAVSNESDIFNQNVLILHRAVSLTNQSIFERYTIPSSMDKNSDKAA